MPHLSDEQARALARRFSAEMEHLGECAECRARLSELSSLEDQGYRNALNRAAEDTLRRLPRVRAEKAAAADPDLIARIDLLEALLRRDLGHARIALELLDRAAEGFVALREHDQLARIVLNRPSFLSLRSRGAHGASPGLGTSMQRQLRSH